MYSVTGDAANEVLAIKIPDEKADTMHGSSMQKWNIGNSTGNLKEVTGTSRSTNSVLGANGRPIYSGPGIQEMLEDSHVYRYTTLTTTLIEEYLMDIFYGRITGYFKEHQGFHW